MREQVDEEENLKQIIEKKGALAPFALGELEAVEFLKLEKNQEVRRGVFDAKMQENKTLYDWGFIARLGRELGVA